MTEKRTAAQVGDARNRPSLEEVLQPRSVAVVGASAVTHESFATGFPVGTGYVYCMKDMGFPGPIYPVNPKYQEVLGLKCYPDLLAIPGPVDHVIVSIPAEEVPELMDQCIQKGVRSIQLFTAGFSEAGVRGEALEREILTKARQGGIRILGLNCVGVYRPRSGLALNTPINPLLAPEPGPVGLLSQSGGNIHYLIGWGALRGLRFSTAISYGNAVDVDEAEILEYLAQDPETEIIGAYIEGVKDGRRFFQALKAAATRKPTVILKGGRTQGGSRTVLSHTASLAGSGHLFPALLRQAGAVAVEDLEGLVDMLVAFRFLRPLGGPGIGLIGIGGGASVLAADAMEEAGLRVPPLPEEVQQELRRFTPVAGSFVHNPVDSIALYRVEHLMETVRLVAEAPDIDLVILHASFGPFHPEKSSRFILPTLLEASLPGLEEVRRAVGKPIALILPPPLSPQEVEEGFQVLEQYSRAGFPVFHSPEKGARAAARLLAWQAQRQG